MSAVIGETRDVRSLLGKLCGLFVRPATDAAPMGAHALAASPAAAAPVRAAAVAPDARRARVPAAVWTPPVSDVADEVRTAPATIAVLCARGTAGAAGAIIALAAARRGGGSCGVVCTWTGSDDAAGRSAAGGGFAVGRARRLAARLTRRGMEGRARGRLVRVELPPEPVEAAALAERVAAAAGETPVVTVVAGTRPAAFDALLAAQDRVVVVPPCGDLEDVGRLAVLDAARIARAVGLLELPAVGLGRLALRSGLVLPPMARRAANDALDGHGD